MKNETITLVFQFHDIDKILQFGREVLDRLFPPPQDVAPLTDTLKTSADDLKQAVDQNQP